MVVAPVRTVHSMAKAGHIKTAKRAASAKKASAKKASAKKTKKGAKRPKLEEGEWRPDYGKKYDSMLEADEQKLMEGLSLDEKKMRPCPARFCRASATSAELLPIEPPAVTTKATPEAPAPINLRLSSRIAVR